MTWGHGTRFPSQLLVHPQRAEVGNMIIERFCTAHVVQTKNFHRLPPGLIGADGSPVKWLDGSKDWDQRVHQLVDLLHNAPDVQTF
eukprot:4479183-Amphidinium_carterae.1